MSNGYKHVINSSFCNFMRSLAKKVSGEADVLLLPDMWQPLELLDDSDEPGSLWKIQQPESVRSRQERDMCLVRSLGRKVRQQ